MLNIVNRFGWKAIILTVLIIGGCENAVIGRPGGGKPLTGNEMDQVTAGSAAAVNQVEAVALGSAPQTFTSASTLADAGGSPMAGAPLLNYASSKIVASANSDLSAQASGSSQVQIDGGNGGVWINAAAASTATGSTTNHAEVDMQFTGLSTSDLDLVYGSITAAACCNSSNRIAAEVNSAAGGPYKSRLQVVSASNTFGQTQSQIDTTIISSTLPLLNVGQGLAVTALGLWQISISQ